MMNNGSNETLVSPLVRRMASTGLLKGTTVKAKKEGLVKSQATHQHEFVKEV